MDKLEKLMMMKKKKSKPLSDVEKDAKMSVVKDMADYASKAMKEGMKGKGLKKVTVASNSPEGLEEGLEKAEEIIKDRPSDVPVMDMEDAEEALPEHSASENDEMSEEEIDAKLAELMEMKKKLKGE